MFYLALLVFKILKAINIYYMVFYSNFSIKICISKIAPFCFFFWCPLV